ncbi:response regulator [Nostocoides sp. F2B08]|uniref:response regulator n=1 Tax=Nostocoides sp. F2B08 TaxID=2653936 RepID=UPI0012639564|nr:response regulator transcription factor [Tetrasphaera sp. F2B08]KAB7744185.1 response regulator [Tetrasphaera sp. F2B08]
MIRVLLVDDQTLVRAGIRSLLSLAEDVDVVGEAGDGQAALDLIADTQPDVVLLDLRMPVLDGIGTLRGLRAARHRPAVLVLTTFDDDDEVLAALREGAQGYLLKDVTLEALLEAIRTLADGGQHIQPAVSSRLLHRLAAGGTTGHGPDDTPRQEELTEREVDVLRLMAAGWSNREIAAGLHLAEGTVKNHVSSILLKLGVRDRTRAVLRALETGLVDRAG